MFYIDRTTISDPKTSDMSKENLLLETGNEDILDISQEDAGHSDVVDNGHLDEELDVLNSVNPFSQDL